MCATYNLPYAYSAKSKFSRRAAESHIGSHIIMFEQAVYFGAVGEWQSYIGLLFWEDHCYHYQDIRDFFYCPDEH